MRSICEWMEITFEQIGIVGGTGYTGVELLRMLFHIKGLRSVVSHLGQKRVKQSPLVSLAVACS